MVLTLLLTKVSWRVAVLPLVAGVDDGPSVTWEASRCAGRASGFRLSADMFG